MENDLDLTIPVAIELDPSLGALPDAEDTQTFERRLASGLNTLLKRLGLTGEPEIELRSVESNRVVRVRVHGVLQPYSSALVERVGAALVSTDSDDPPERLETTLQPDSPDASLGQQDRNRAFEYLARLVLEVIQEHPACLVGPAQVAAYLRNGSGEWPDSRSSASIEALSSVLESLLDLKVSVADKSLVLQVVNADYASGRSVEDMAEEAFVRLRSSKVEIHAHPQYLEALAAGEPIQEPLSVYAEQFGDDLRSWFRSMEQTLFNDLGLRLPDLVWVPSREVSEGMIAVKINDRVKPPTPTPQERQIVGVVYGELTRAADLLLSIEDVEYLLAQLAQSYPVLVQTTMAQFSIGDITRVLRGLLRENISIENSRAILERLLQYEEISVESNGCTVFDDRFVLEEGAPSGSAHDWKNYREFVRSGLKDYIGYKYAQDQNELHVFSIDRKLEAFLEATATNDRGTGARADLDEAQQEALRDAIWNELGSLADTSARLLVILTTSSARAKIRELIAPELPDLPVLARSELPPGINVDPIATISLA